MKAQLALLAALAAVLCVSYAEAYPTECPLIDPTHETILIKHESDCTKFYMCLRGAKIERNCPLMTEGDKETRLHFNPKVNACDWPFDAACFD